MLREEFKTALKELEGREAPKFDELLVVLFKNCGEEVIRELYELVCVYNYSNIEESKDLWTIQNFKFDMYLKF